MGFFGTGSGLIGLEQLEGIDNSNEEHGQPGAGAHPVIGGVAEVLHNHAGQSCCEILSCADKPLSPDFHAFLKIIISVGSAGE